MLIKKPLALGPWPLPSLTRAVWQDVLPRKEYESPGIKSAEFRDAYDASTCARSELTSQRPTAEGQRLSATGQRPKAKRQWPTAKDQRRRILFTSYPLLPVSDESCGGAEQMLWTLERELHRRGHDTAVAACEGSRVSGELITTGAVPDGCDQLTQREAEHNQHLLRAVDQARKMGKPFDLIHDHGGLFWRSVAAQVEEPVLATLHLPFDFYGAESFEKAPENVSFNFVSRAQREAIASHVPKLHRAPVVSNGVAVNRFSLQPCKQDYLLWLGRICEEKGTHVAIEISIRANLPLIIAGQVYPFSYHQAYFKQRIVPKLGGKIRFVEKPVFAHKRELLAGARALLVPTLVDETSSLVAMEAMACGTPVLAFRRGALGEVVKHGETGFLVETVAEMLDAIARVSTLGPAACRHQAEQRFDAAGMAMDYETLYTQILKEKSAAAA